MAAFIKTKLKATRDALSKKDFQLAIDSANQVLSYDAENYTANVFLGLACLELGQTAESESAFRKASSSAPEQILAWQGFTKLYERTKQWSLYVDALEMLMKIFSKSQDATKCAETFQKLLEFRREHGSSIEVAETLSLLLPESQYYSTLALLPAPEPTAPNSTTTFLTQTAIYDSLPIIQEILSIREKSEQETIKKEVENRRTRLGAPPLRLLQQEVELEFLRLSQLPTLYREIIGHPNTSDELRRSTEAKLLRHLHKYLVNIPAAKSPEYATLKAALREEVKNMVDGVVLLEIPDELAWSLWLEDQDIGELDQYDVKSLRRLLVVIPGHPICGLVRAFLVYQGYSLKEDDESDDSQEAIDEEEEDPLQQIIASFSDNQTSIFAHRVCAHAYLEDEDHENSIKVAQAGLELLIRSETSYGRPLVQVQKSFDVILATSLVHFYPPKHHPRALPLLNNVIKLEPNNVQALIGRAYVLQYSKNWLEACKLFHRVVELKGVEDQKYGLEAREEELWCEIKGGNGISAMGQLSDVIKHLDSLEDHQHQQARAWWRLGQCHWDIGDSDNRKKSFECFITSLKRSPTYAPAFTSTGVYYLEHANPPDLVRASKCFQKAFELDPREGDAARRLAEGFAEDRDWDLVEVIARRTIEGEGGIGGGDSGFAGTSDRRILPKNAWAWKAIGVVELARGNYSQAIQSFQITLRADETDFQSWVRLGEAYARSGRHVAALKALGRAHELTPGDWGCLYITGDVLRQVGRFENAIDYFNQVLGNRPEEMGVLLALSQTHLDLGREQRRSGYSGRAEASFADCISVATQAIERSSGFRSMAWKLAGDALHELSRARLFVDPTTIAATFLTLGSNMADQSILEGYTPTTTPDEKSNTPNFIPLTVGAMLSQLQGGEADGLTAAVLAIAVYNRRAAILEKDEKATPSAVFDVATALMQLALTTGNVIEELCHKKAITLIKQALYLEPGNGAFWTALGVLTFQSDAKLSQHAFIRAVEQDSKSSAAWTNLGLLYMQHDDRELANHAFYRAQTLNPDYDMAWVGQGLLAAANGHMDDARALFQHAVGLSAETSPADLEFAGRVFLQFSKGVEDFYTTSTEQLLLPFAILDRYCNQKPLDASALHLYALICERLGLYDLSADLLLKAINILDAQYNQSEDAVTELQFCTSHVSLGRVRLGIADYEGALEAFDIASNLLTPQNDSQDIQVLYMQAQMGVGIASSKLADLTKALETFEGLLQEVSSDFPDVKAHTRLLLSQTLWAIGTTESQEMAKTQLLSSITENPRDLEAITTLAAVGILGMDDDLLEAALAEITSMAPHERQILDPSHTVENLLVRYHTSTGKNVIALSILLSAVHASPTSASSRQKLATFLLQLKRANAAQTILEGIMTSQEYGSRSTLSDSLSLLAVASREGNQGEAVKVAQKGVFLAPWNIKAKLALDFSH